MIGGFDMYCFACDPHSVGESKICPVCGKPFATDPDRYFKAGMDAMVLGDLEHAIQYLQDCVTLNPKHFSGRYNLGLALALTDRCNEAMEHYMAIARDDPSYPGIYTALGQAAFGSYMTHLDEAEQKRRVMILFFMKAIEADPEDVDAYFSLGNAYMAVGSAGDAVPYLEKALSIHPDSPAIYYTLAKAHIMLQGYDKAIELATRAIDLSGPEDPFRQDVELLLSELEQAA
jgi:tetratricopeptide (TPR) repeat protein